MKTENIILAITPEGNFEAWATLSDFCNQYGFSRNTLYKESFPIDYRGFNLQKLSVNRNKSDTQK